MNPEHVFWGMPRRIRLKSPIKKDFETIVDLRCAICGLADEKMYLEYQDKTGGLSYQEKYRDQDGKNKKRPSWVNPIHPLSPHTSNKDRQFIAVHPQPGGVGYSHWLGFIYGDTDGDKQSIVAGAVEQFRTLMRSDGDLWAFGFDMDNMKARCWYDSKMPILIIQGELEDLFKDIASRLVRAAEKTSIELCKHLKLSMFDEKSKITINDFDFAKSEFWASTEAAFYEHLRRLRDTLPSDLNAYPVRESWWRTIRDSAFMVFDQHSRTGDFDAVDPRKIAEARNGLGKVLNGSALKQKILGLPKPSKPRRQKS